MSQKDSFFNRPEFIPRNARYTADPPAEWRNGKLYITVYRGETEDISLSEDDLKDCQKEAQVRKVTLDSVIKEVKLNKAARLNYNELKLLNRIPERPTKEAVKKNPSAAVQVPKETDNPSSREQSFNEEFPGFSKQEPSTSSSSSSTPKKGH